MLIEGSIATDYQPYNGQITHNGDAPVVFAELERQKSKNLIEVNNGLDRTNLGLHVQINNEVISVGMIDRATRDSKGYITEKINGEIGEWLTAQKRNVRIIVDNIQEVRDDLGVLEIKDNEFWEKKLKFLEEQNEILGKILRRIENSLEFVEFVEHNMTDIVDKIMTVKY